MSDACCAARGRVPLACTLLLPICALLPPSPTAAQSLIKGYALNVGTANGSSPLVHSAASDLQRLRLMAQPVAGTLHFDFAYEHTLQLRDRADAGMVFATGETRASGDWLTLDGTLHASDHIRLASPHRSSERRLVE